MAGDWIKMRTDLYRDPKVCIISDQLMCEESDLSRYVNQICHRDMAVTRNVMRNVTVGALVAVWGVNRHRGKRVGDDLFVRGVTVSVVDDIAELPGFGKAMEHVGWVEQTEDGIIFPRFFEEFNVDPAEDAKKKNSERQRRFREKSNVTSNVTVTPNSNTEKSREEKSREENKKPPLPPLPFESEEFKEAWSKWESFRKQKKATLTPLTVEQNFKKFVQWGEQRAIAAIYFTIDKGWTGLREDEKSLPFQTPNNGTPVESVAERMQKAADAFKAKGGAA